LEVCYIVYHTRVLSFQYLIQLKLSQWDKEAGCGVDDSKIPKFNRENQEEGKL